jgi:hypothetical protein
MKSGKGEQGKRISYLKFEISDFRDPSTLLGIPYGGLPPPTYGVPKGLRDKLGITGRDSPAQGQAAPPAAGKPHLRRVNSGRHSANGRE